MTNIRTYRVNLGWSQRQMAREAGVSPLVIKRAEEGLSIRPDMAKTIADMLSRVMGKEIRPSDIDGLNIV
jgi:predicted transcriptional regulator